MGFCTNPASLKCVSLVSYPVFTFAWEFVRWSCTREGRPSNFKHLCIIYVFWTDFNITERSLQTIIVLSPPSLLFLFAAWSSRKKKKTWKRGTSQGNLWALSIQPKLSKIWKPQHVVQKFPRTICQQILEISSGSKVEWKIKLPEKNFSIPHEAVLCSNFGKSCSIRHWKLPRN